MDVDNEYIDKIFDYVQNIPKGGRVLLTNITNTPEKFINCVKHLIETGKLDSNDIFFRSAYNKEGEKLGNNNYQVLCKSRIPSSLTKLNKNGIKNNTDRESGEDPGDETSGQ